MRRARPPACDPTCCLHSVYLRRTPTHAVSGLPIACDHPSSETPKLFFVQEPRKGSPARTIIASMGTACHDLGIGQATGMIDCGFMDCWKCCLSSRRTTEDKQGPILLAVNDETAVPTSSQGPPRVTVSRYRLRRTRITTPSAQV